MQTLSIILHMLVIHLDWQTSGFVFRPFKGSMREWGYELTTKSGMASAFNKVFNQTGYVSDRIAMI